MPQAVRVMLDSRSITRDAPDGSSFDLPPAAARQDPLLVAIDQPALPMALVSGVGR